MRRTSRNNEVCFENLEKALAESPETYRHLDLIAFGFPCQDISNANPKGQGLKGKRSSLFFEAMRIVNVLVPQWLIIENVPRLLSINEGRDFATVLWTLSESGYGYSWRVLDSQYFGVAQRRKRVFIVGYFGRECPPEILFEQKSSGRNDKTKRKIRQRGLCISAREGERQDPTAETHIASAIHNYPEEKLPPPQNRQYGLVAQTIGASKRGNTSFVWQDTHIAETNPCRKRKTTRTFGKLDSARGIVIGNAITVQVAEWIGKRIAAYEKKQFELLEK